MGRFRATGPRRAITRHHNQASSPSTARPRRRLDAHKLDYGYRVFDNIKKGAALDALERAGVLPGRRTGQRHSRGSTLGVRTPTALSIVERAARRFCCTVKAQRGPPSGPSGGPWILKMEMEAWRGISIATTPSKTT